MAPIESWHSQVICSGCAGSLPFTGVVAPGGKMDFQSADESPICEPQSARRKSAFTAPAAGGFCITATKVFAVAAVPPYVTVVDGMPFDAIGMVPMLSGVIEIPVGHNGSVIPRIVWPHTVGSMLAMGVPAEMPKAVPCGQTRGVDTGGGGETCVFTSIA